MKIIKPSVEEFIQGAGFEGMLKHIERCRVIVHLVDMGGEEGRNPIEDYRIINEELKSYNLRLLDRPQIVVANKMDLDEAENNLKAFKEAYPDLEVFETTTIIHEGLDPILTKAANLLEKTPPFPIMEEETMDTGVTYTFEEKKKDFTIEHLQEGLWKVDGPRLERIFDIKKLNTEEDFYLFANRLRYLGIYNALREAGCQDGDTVQLCGFEFEFIEN